MLRRFITRQMFVLLFPVTVGYSQTQPSVSTPPAVNFNLDETHIMTPEERTRSKEEATDVIYEITTLAEEQYLLREILNFIRQHMQGDDLALEKSLIVDTIHSEEVNAHAHYTDGKRYITFTTGLYRYLDLLVDAQVISRHFKTPKCAISYTAYLTLLVSENTLRERQHMPSEEVLLPEFYAAHHLDICPKVKPEEDYYTTDDEWSRQYRIAMRASFLFVTMHEFAHVRNGDIYLPNPQQDTVSRKIFAKQQVERESAADALALDFFTNKVEAPPLLALPIMFLVAIRQNYSVVSGEFDDHPLTVSRIDSMIAESTKTIKSNEFRKWAGEDGSTAAVKDSKQFQEYLLQIVK